MVLTRLAARAHKSIVRWLPNEILTMVMSYLLQHELVVLCRTSRLFRNLATPMVYRSVTLSTRPQIQFLVRTMTQRSGPSLSNYVREFCITDEEFELTPALIKCIPTVLFKFTRLEALGLLRTDAIECTDMLRDAYFPNLSSFQYTLQHQTASLIPPFLNRHPTISDLGLIHGPDPIDQMDVISLPNLTTYSGPGTIACSFGSDTNQIMVACLFWYPDDLDVDGPLLHLNRISSSSLLGIMTMSVSDHPDRLKVLQRQAAHLPHLVVVQFWRLIGVCARISREDALKIATCLKQFTSLTVLELDNPEQHNGVNVDINHDRELILLWSRSCKSLSEISLNGRVWTLEHDRWRIS
ncbi:hypothetical protein MSAN_01601900 [Mycena sanguinolenta]|uniref:F-box domain-containing protein n=1 Tax=Mycena sanguinolenta TaxID=230812 RepID=A0A8H6Y0C8_9AGAR|nr:hypothetical protein MSAN_01601900 [Mycena sanguinolenta]